VPHALLLVLIDLHPLKALLCCLTITRNSCSHQFAKSIQQTDVSIAWPVHGQLVLHHQQWSVTAVGHQTWMHP
jgi:hypothetical protein